MKPDTRIDRREGKPYPIDRRDNTYTQMETRKTVQPNKHVSHELSYLKLYPLHISGSGYCMACILKCRSDIPDLMRQVLHAVKLNNSHLASASAKLTTVE
jgi:hypothetical protein